LIRKFKELLCTQRTKVTWRWLGTPSV